MPNAAVRASVRQMVEFTLRGGDLGPVSLFAMQEGGRAHRARQQNENAIAERPVRWQGVCEGLSADIQGRVDMLWEDSDPLCVEELKLIGADAPLPDAPLPVHRMQAVCYGFMLCEELRLPSVAVRVSYVTANGLVRAQFDETLTQAQAESAFFSMLRPLAQWEKMQQDYRQVRNASLHALAFPYPAYRPGQREMAVQVYTAIDRQKRLFATLPTGTGKSAATLFPALKALGEDKAEQLFYLTARGTAQLSALDAIQRMRAQGLISRSVVLMAREKCCPMPTVHCHPDACPRAKGYFDRELPALMALCAQGTWTAQDVSSLCEERQLCPFEFSLALSEISDVVICDYNYVFDPMVSLKRIIGQGKPVTLLIDEAHNLPSRARDMLSAVLDSRDIAALRRETGKLHGRKSALYTAMSALLAPLRAFEAEQSPSDLLPPLEALIDCMSRHFSDIQPAGYQELFRALLQFRIAVQRMQAQPAEYQPLLSETAKERRICLLCLDVSTHLKTVTQRMRGCVYFSATLSPLEEMRALLGGTEEDAIFALPSPFPPERLLVLRHDINTRFQQRADSAEEIAQSILALFQARDGKYIAYFPSYAYLALVEEQLRALQEDLPLNVQGRGMDEAAREAFLGRMRSENGPLLSLCVLGGVFSEGIDLPGSQLIGAVIVGVGLPQVNPVQEALRAHYAQTLGDGFAYAYRYPGMQKVLQAAGRVIRSETDAGIVLLLDARYGESAYACLLPPHYHVTRVANSDEIRARAQEFWQLYGIKQ